MKNYITILVMCFCIAKAHAQIGGVCVAPNVSLGIIGSIPVEYIPNNFTADIWITPSIIVDRPIYFIHGLGGQGDEDGSLGISWSQASIWVEHEYFVNSRRPDYADVSLEFAAIELKGDLEDYEVSDEDAILIAHSQGGIVSRRVDQMYTTGEVGAEPRTFGGLITFGSPHQGAMILNNRDDLMEWITPSCENLTDGPLTEEVENSFFLDLFLNPADIDEFQELICGTLEHNIAPFVFRDYFSGITESYQVGSEQLAELNTFIPEIPYICFYGTETEPIIWNTLTHILPGHEPNNTVTYGADPFESGGDTYFFNYADEMMDKYYSKYIQYDNIADEYYSLLYDGDLESILCYLSVICAINANNALDESIDIRDAYKKGYDWFANANTTWQGIIGAGSFEAETYTCSCYNYGAFGTFSYEEYTVEEGEYCYTDDYNTDCTATVNFNWEVKPSDGVVLVESASECNGNLAGVASRNMPGSNHFSMRNDINTKLRLIETFDGLHGEFFITPER
jgi:hypothetical protein